MRFIDGIKNCDELFDLINENTNNFSETTAIIIELESVYGSILSASAGARRALRDGLVPFVGGKYDGHEEEYHHIEFESGVESIPFKMYEE